jgi:ATP-binding cassette subfamily B protein
LSELPTALRAMRRVLALSVQAMPQLACVSTALTAYEFASSALLALSIRGLVNAVSVGASAESVIWAASTALLVAISEAVHWSERLLATATQERLECAFDQRLMQLAGSLPGLEHHDAALYRDRISALRDEKWAVTKAFDTAATTAGWLLQLALSAVLLAQVDPRLLAIPGAGLLLLCGELAALRVDARSEDELAKRARASLRTLELLYDPRSAREVRLLGLRQVLRARHWTELSERIRLEDRVAAGRLLRVGLASLGYALGLGSLLVFALNRGVGALPNAGDLVLVALLATGISGQMTAAARQVGALGWVARGAQRYLWLEEYAARAVRSMQPAQPRPVPARLARGIALEGVSFRYPGAARAALEQIDIAIPAGAVVALVGENGSGKSTLLKLLLRFYDPASGRIRIDGTDLRELQVCEWRARCSAAFQDFVRPELSLRDVVQLGDLGADERAIRRGLTRAGARSLASRLPAGLQQQLGTRFAGAMNLSTGQWQKLALARGWMRSAPLVFALDEPSSALDPLAEAALVRSCLRQMRLRAARSGCITFLVTHRLAAARAADLILVLRQGRLIERGTHRELVRAGGLYAELAAIQAQLNHPESVPTPLPSTSLRAR